MDLPGFPSQRPNFRPEGLYGSLEPFLQGIRTHAPLDLSLARWRKANPDGTFEEWRKIAKAFALEKLSYAPGPVDLQAKTLKVEDRGDFIAELVEFNTAPWSRVEGWFLRPKGEGPFPAVVALHSWGGPMLLGKDRLVSRGKSHPRLQQLLDSAYSGRMYAEDLARLGYAVIAIDAHHFGSRLPWGAWIGQNSKEQWLPRGVDPLDLSVEEFDRLDQVARDIIYFNIKCLGWAGVTWAGINFWDDSRCIDYLVSRPEVDSARIGCVGQSGGGWRSHFLAALDDRVTASVSACWTTTGDWNHLYNCTGSIGCFSMIPGLWQRMDLPDIGLLAAPRAKMLVTAMQDQLFPPEGMEAAAARMREGYEWIGQGEKFQVFAPDVLHQFNKESQARAWEFFARWLGPDS